MNREDALKKIKKCLALSRSAEPHEASAALRQAQKLMAEHRITDRELSLVDVVEVKAKACSLAANAWEVRLCRLISEAFGCEMYSLRTEGFDPKTMAYKREHFYVFVGLEAAPTVAGYAYEVLSRQCARARLAHIGKQPKNCKPITKTARGDAFAKGWVFGVEELVRKFAQPARDEALLLEYMETRHGGMATSKTRDASKARRTDWGHAAAGIRAAESAQLNRGVDGVQPLALLN